ncbi:MAG TPA: hypothetical protein VGR52_09505 [Stellaceae bacterium]|nr:hypothetical protein [Stellaceae bacterium]
MARIRSPNYPAISLPEAISRVKAIHAAEQHLAAPKEVIAKHLGYNGLNGASIKMISAISKYGLLEEIESGKMKVSPLAMTVLYPAKPEEKVAAIQEAAFKPTLFTEIANEWPQGKPSDENLRAWLMRRNFATDAVDRVIQSYRETTDLVAQESGHYTPLIESQGKGGRSLATTHALQRQQTTTFTPASGAEPFRVTFTGNGIEIAGRITDEASADDLVRAVNALKLLLKPLAEIKKPNWADKPFSPGEKVPGTTPFRAHHVGHAGDSLIEPDEGDTFPTCDKCGDKVRYTLA